MKGKILQKQWFLTFSQFFFGDGQKVSCPSISSISIRNLEKNYEKLKIDRSKKPLCRKTGLRDILLEGPTVVILGI